ncbi:MAG TPA: FtsX-like permease family protein [Candidatus Anaerobiospirillum stercoravium]|nr:FtsX-like permease family protein [Candidatus Anaerobiospirillum stercoravium]
MLFKLAVRHLLFERMMTICQIAALACLMAPLLLLFSLRFGILQELQNQLLNDPKVLALTLDTSYRLDATFFKQLEQRPEVGFLVPQITALNALIDLKFPGTVARVSVLPTKVGDPVVLRSGIPYEQELAHDEVLVSYDLAQVRELSPGDSVTMVVSRIQNGKRESVRTQLKIKGIVSERFVGDDSLLLNLDMVNAIDDYRNGFNPVLLSDGSNVNTHPRLYAKFRLYAKDLEQVIPLYYYLVDQHLNVSSKVREIENVKALAHVLNFIFGVIASVSLIGGALALTGLVLSALRASKRNFVLLRLMGQGQKGIYSVVLVEGMIISALGFILSLVLYSLGAGIFNTYFGTTLGGSMISQLTVGHIALFFAATVLLVMVISLSCAKFVFLKAHIADILREA